MLDSFVRRSWLGLCAWTLLGCAEGDATGAGTLPPDADVEASSEASSCLCVPGVATACSCDNGVQGLKRCNNDCLAYGPCIGCDVGDSGTPPDGSAPDSGADSSADAGPVDGGDAGVDGAADAGPEAGSACGIPLDLCPGKALVLAPAADDTFEGNDTGDTCELCPLQAGSCALTGSTAGREAVYAVEAPATGTLVAALQQPPTAHDSVLYVRSQCDDPDGEIGCDDSHLYGKDRVSVEVQENQTYFVFVDGYGPLSCGPYELQVQVVPEKCGNGHVEGSEECDDGNNTASDGCSPDCKQEHMDTCPGFLVSLVGSGDQPRVGQVTHSTANLTADHTGSCAASSAGAKDAVVQVIPDVDGLMSLNLGGAAETPFDSVLYVRQDCTNETTELGCHDAYNDGAETLELEVQAGQTYYVFVDGYLSQHGPFTLHVTVTPPCCGDGTVDNGEACDDGNQVDGDGCSASCEVEAVGVGDLCPGADLVPVSINELVIATQIGSTASMGSSYGGSCGSSDTSKDRVYHFHANETGRVQVSLLSPFTDYDSVLYVRGGACSGAGADELVCSNVSGKGGETVQFAATAGSDYWIFVDGEAGAEGQFKLELVMNVSQCGNGQLEPGEACDDGNQVALDGCDPTCSFEAACDSVPDTEPNPRPIASSTALLVRLLSRASSLAQSGWGC